MCFYDSFVLPFFHLERCFFFVLFLEKENAAKTEDNHYENGILDHRSQRNQCWTASSKSFSGSHIDKNCSGGPCSAAFK